MSVNRHERPQAEGRRHLSSLWAAIVDARAQEESARGRGSANVAKLQIARVNTLHALEDYSRALDSLAWPVPRAIQMDITLHRALCNPSPAGPRRTY